MLVVLGFLVGTLGTLIGAGGGFVLVPVLLILYPLESPESITSVSLAVVFFNALSGSVAYAKMRRIDYRLGWLLALATVPGAIAGALTTDLIPRQVFNAIFGILILLLSFYLILHRERRERRNSPSSSERKGHITRTLVEKDGTIHHFSYNLKAGLSLSVVVGYASTLLGIGGGIIHVPILARIMDFPVHIATATSHFILAIMAFAGTIVHIARQTFSASAVNQTLLLGLGVLVGAQVGAWLSGRLRGEWIIRSLAFALALVGFRILWMTLRG